jgi:predicted nuclease of predicted toxin-antitoxin system
MKLLVDMNLSPRWATTFVSAISADHWSTIGRHDASDGEVMAYAREHGYVVLTNDLDFSAILAASGARGPPASCRSAPTISIQM